MTDSTTKQCCKCGNPHPLSSFTLDKRYADGRYPWCAGCRRAWRQGRKERQQELQRNWIEQHRDHVNEQARQNYIHRKDKIAPRRRAYDRRRWKEDAEYRKRKNEWKQNKYRADPAFRAQKLRLSSNRHRRLYHTDPVYRANKRAYSAAYAPRRNRYGRDARGKFTTKEWRNLCEQYHNLCLRCGEQKPLSPDHIQPLSRQGANSIDNIQPLCEECNEWKLVKTIDYRPLWGSDTPPTPDQVRAYEIAVLGDF